jgi:polyisoprenoid-binding protein YceI
MFGTIVVTLYVITRIFNNQTMKKLFYPIAAGIILSASAFTALKTTDWKIKNEASVKFTSKDPSGVFTGLKGSVKFNEQDLKDSKFDVSIDAASINTGNGMQNQHAKSDKWFDVKKYPEIRFASNSITRTTQGYQADGILSLHGVQKPVSIPFTFQKNNEGGTFTGSFNVNRVDFGIGEPGGHASEIIKIDLSVPVNN